MAKVTFPLEKVNELIDGGVEDGANVLLLADLVVDKSKFASALVNFRLEEEDNLVYFVNNRLPQYVKNYVAMDRYGNQVSFIDGFSATLDRESDEAFALETDAKDDKATYIDEAAAVTAEALREREGYGSTFVLDSLDAWVGHWDALEDYLAAVKPVAEDTNTVCYYLLPNLGFDEDDDGADIGRLREMFDYVFHLKGLERSGFVLSYIDILKPEVETKVPFDITPEGLVMYLPKILVTGPYNAGKSTTVQSMSETAVSVDRLGTTVALDHGTVERRGLKADLFGTPGQERFDWALDFLGQSMFGCFLVMDSRNPDYDRAKEMLEKLQSKGIPTIILANFQNQEDALPPGTIADEMGITTVGVDAKHGDGLDEAMDTLFDTILSQHSWYYA